MAVIDRETADHYLWQGDCDGWRLLDRADMAVIAEKMPPGRAETRHYHETARQLFYVLSGSLAIDLGGTLFHLNAGQALQIPPGRRHQVANDGTEAAEFLVISVPSTRDDRIEV
ncbi:MAG: cupin domain-containing protein [Pseudooceanicola sp.]|nr:cupin domain-containing protein [Pseudooceanicola sp.]